MWSCVLPLGNCLVSTLQTACVLLCQQTFVLASAYSFVSYVLSPPLWSVTYTAVVGTDNCPGSTTLQTAGLASGATFPVGTTTNTFRVTDASGNSATCSFTVTITDNELPGITCPANVSQNVTSGTCGRVVTFTSPVGSDNCSGPTTIQTAGFASGATFPLELLPTPSE
ncbi:MAG: HYR domain-containing protein [Saprospiraceae bacterium]|nr:HYR domain-containing protein [Saprospiraceae bacterium]